MKEIKHQLKKEHLQSLIEGKKLILDYFGLPTVTIYPPNYGVFVPHEEYQVIFRNLTDEQKAKLEIINYENNIS